MSPAWTITKSSKIAESSSTSSITKSFPPFLPVYLTRGDLPSHTPQLLARTYCSLISIKICVGQTQKSKDWFFKAVRKKNNFKGFFSKEMFLTLNLVRSWWWLAFASLLNCDWLGFDFKIRNELQECKNIQKMCFFKKYHNYALLWANLTEPRKCLKFSLKLDIFQYFKFCQRNWASAEKCREVNLKNQIFQQNFFLFAERWLICTATTAGTSFWVKAGYQWWLTSTWCI